MQPSIDNPTMGRERNFQNGKLIRLESHDLGPGAIATPSVKGGPAFSLSATQWIAIQTYVINALALPNTTEKFKLSLGTGAPEDLSDFEALIKAYDTLYKHVSHWQTEIFPTSVSLASDIYNYAQQAPVYYEPILENAQILSKDPHNETAKQELLELLNILSTDADNNYKRALAVEEDIRQFAKDTTTDKLALGGPDGKSGLKKHYNDKYGETSEEVKTLTKSLEAQKIVLDAANAEYDHDVIVAATTPTYGMIFPLGTIAAAVVAGIYGDKAIKALERVRAAQQEINSLSAKLAADAKLLIAINNTVSGISNILDPLNAALPIIQQIQGVWQAIGDDTKNITKLVNENIKEVGPSVMKFGVKAAINAWRDVGKMANEYRLNAYVTIKTF